VGAEQMADDHSTAEGVDFGNADAADAGEDVLPQEAEADDVDAGDADEIGLFDEQAFVQQRRLIGHEDVDRRA
jgi:hypothetical protein